MVTTGGCEISSPNGLRKLALGWFSYVHTALGIYPDMRNPSPLALKLGPGEASASRRFNALSPNRARIASRACDMCRVY